MDSQAFDAYLKQANQLIQDSAFGALLEFIDQHLQYEPPTTIHYPFFLGERAFYSKHYDQALKHYVEARGIANHNFYCFRTSAYISEARRDYERALNFVKKALDVIPDDTFSLSLLRRVQSATDKQPHSEVLEEPLNELFPASDDRLPPETEKEIPRPLFSEEFSYQGIAALPATAAETAVELKLKTLLDNQKASGIAGSLVSSPYHVHPFRQGDTPFAGQEEKETKRISSTDIETKIARFHNEQKKRLEQYVQQCRLPKKQGSSLFFFNTSPAENNLNWLVSDRRKAATGIYIRWNEKGIALNPGPDFLTRLHEAGFFITDIDAVIVTREGAEVEADLTAIYELNAQINSLSNSIHIIQYYLNDAVFQQRALGLKPLYKQEKNRVHAFEHFMDSRETESLDLFPDVKLHYFKPQNGIGHSSSSVGIKLELFDTERKERESLTIGYVSGFGWHPLLAHQLGSCTILIAGIGNVSTDDLNGTSYSKDEVGYSGALSLAEEIQPDFLLCTEFGNRVGDVRLEIVQKIKNALSQQGSSIIPAEMGFTLHLKNLTVQSSSTGLPVLPDQLRIVTTAPLFGSLYYLATESCLTP